VRVGGGMYWCYREKPENSNGLPVGEVQALVDKHRGRLIPIVGFDELMVQVWDKLALTSLTNELTRRFNAIAGDYLNDLQKVATEMIDRGEGSGKPTLEAAARSGRSVLKRLMEDSD